MKRLRLFASILLFVLTASGQSFAAERMLVLVASSASVHDGLSPFEMRKAFLGYPLKHNGHETHPLGNRTDPRLQEAFLQKIMFMSDQVYERQLTGMMFRYGLAKPPEYSNLAELARALANDPDSISYMWMADAQQFHNIKVIAQSWHED